MPEEQRQDAASQLITNFDSMKNVLAQRKFIDVNEQGQNILTTKGEVLSKVRGYNEIFLSEMISGGHLNDVSPQMLAGLLSSVTTEMNTYLAMKEFKGKTVSSSYKEDLQWQKHSDKLDVLRNNILKCQEENGLDNEEYPINLDFQIMSYVKNWCETDSKDWSEMVDKVVHNTDINQEGTFFRVLNNTSDLIMQVLAITDNLRNSLEDQGERDRMSDLNQCARKALKMLKKPPLQEKTLTV